MFYMLPFFDFQLLALLLQICYFMCLWSVCFQSSLGLQLDYSLEPLLCLHFRLLLDLLFQFWSNCGLDLPLITLLAFGLCQTFLLNSCWVLVLGSPLISILIYSSLCKTFVCYCLCKTLTCCYLCETFALNA